MESLLRKKKYPDLNDLGLSEEDLKYYKSFIGNGFTKEQIVKQIKEDNAITEKLKKLLILKR